MGFKNLEASKGSNNPLKESINHENDGEGVPDNVTHFSEFKHPNEMSTGGGEGEGGTKDHGKCFTFFDNIDKIRIRPCLIYKYHKIKLMSKFDFEDVLVEYKVIEDELNNDDNVGSVSPNNRD